MKRVLAIVMSVSMMAAMLIGCGSGSADETNLSNTNLEKYVCTCVSMGKKEQKRHQLTRACCTAQKTISIPCNSL